MKKYLQLVTEQNHPVIYSDRKFHYVSDETFQIVADDEKLKVIEVKSELNVSDYLFPAFLKTFVGKEIITKDDTFWGSGGSVTTIISEDHIRTHIYDYDHGPFTRTWRLFNNKVIGSLREYTSLLNENYRYSIIHINYDLYIQMLPLNKLITVSEILSGEHSKFKLEDRVEFTKKSNKFTGNISAFLKNNIKVTLDDGTLYTVALSKLEKSDEEKKDVNFDMLDFTTESNFSDVLFSGNFKVFELTKKTFRERRSYRSGELEDVEKIVYECDKCGTLTPKDKQQCTHCGKTINIIKESSDKILALLGSNPKPNSMAIEYAKCCAGCGNFGFGYGRQGKRSTGFCGLTQMCVLGNNVCEQWFPDDIESFNSGIRNSLTNLGYSKGKTNKDKNCRYTDQMHEENKKKGATLKKNYLAGYNNLINLIAKKFNF